MSIKVGDDIDSKCLPSCGPGLVLAHTVVAMDGDKIVKVKCNTCTKTHTYRSPDSASEATAAKRKSARKKREEAAAASTVDFESLAKVVDLNQAQQYSIRAPLDMHQVVEHPKFGTGIVFSLKTDNKAEVIFRDGPRLLVHSRA
ncbi:MAG: hypothetical protein KTR25_18765 [Myxococcales bacterium]|nr:hypothetical protein [Myxococcales bacterium]